MTQKELLYVEDAIGHEDVIIKMCDEAVNTLEDENLISFIDTEQGKHMKIRDLLLNALEEKEDE